ncbi:prefoldin domain-containing protein [Stenotrophomonas maltophilia]|uniref:prefoldin domain-containing protein n=1 Tax=Stenotrophomonas maltophilia TaxID=40324 RepID=UPI0013DCD03D|nr:prefoldin domain-containing protein [Stenotrophomonas maltophilia]
MAAHTSGGHPPEGVRFVHSGRQGAWSFHPNNLARLHELATAEVKRRRAQIARLEKERGSFEAERSAIGAALSLVERAANGPGTASRLVMSDYDSYFQDYCRSIDVDKYTKVLVEIDQAISNNKRRTEELLAAVETAEADIVFIERMIACPQERVFKLPLNPDYIE